MFQSNGLRGRVYFGDEERRRARLDQHDCLPRRAEVVAFPRQLRLRYRISLVKEYEFSSVRPKLINKLR